MKKTITLLLISIITLQAYAQTGDATKDLQDKLTKEVTKGNEGWTKTGILNIGLNQGALQNWAAGGERASLALNGAFNGIATRVKGNTFWENTADLFYGLNYVTSNNFEPRKIDDRIDLSSRYGVQPKSWMNKNILKHTYLTGLARAQTQFSKGYNYADPNFQTVNGGEGISNFLSPLYTTLAVGFNYRKTKRFGVFFSPLAARMIFADKVHTQAPAGAFGIAQNESFVFQLGAYLTANYNANITENISYTSRLDLYSNYLKDPQNVDILWDNIFGMKLGKYIGASLGITMVYDHDVPGQRNAEGQLGDLGWTQLKQVLNIGFQYKIN